MNQLADLLASFDVSSLFPVIKGLADAIGKFLTPALLVVAIYIRLMETQLDGFSGGGGGRYGAALRDMILWTFVLGSYYSLGALVIDFFNPIYTWLDGFGSIKATMAAFANVMAKNKVTLDQAGVTLTGVLSAPYALVAMFFYYATLIIIAFLSAFLKIANVLVFGVAFAWGLVAIPVSISTTFRILRGWAYLLAFALVWPIIQGLLMALFTMLFTGATDNLMAVTDSDPTLRAANIMMLFAVMHLLFAAVLVAAPFVANALVTNTSSASGIVMPFVAAATAAGVATIKGNPSLTGGGGAGARPSAASSAPVVRAPMARATGGGAATPPPPAPATPAAGASVSASSAPAPSPTAPPGPTPQQQAQARRGAIVSQVKKRGP